MKNLKELTKIHSTHCFIINEDGSQTPQFKTFYFRILNEDGSIKYYQISRHENDERYNMITTYQKQKDSTSYHDYEDNKRCKIYGKEEFDKKLDKLAKELEKKNVIFQNLTEQDIIK